MTQPTPSPESFDPQLNAWERDLAVSMNTLTPSEKLIVKSTWKKAQDALKASQTHVLVTLEEDHAAECQSLRDELNTYRLCDGVLDGDPYATDEPTHVNILRLMCERRLARDESQSLRDELRRVNEAMEEASAFINRTEIENARKNAFYAGQLESREILLAAESRIETTEVSLDRIKDYAEGALTTDIVHGDVRLAFQQIAEEARAALATPEHPQNTPMEGEL